MSIKYYRLMRCDEAWRWRDMLADRRVTDPHHGHTHGHTGTHRDTRILIQLTDKLSFKLIIYCTLIN